MAQTCYRHPNRETGVSCSTCGRPICPECMTPTPVGMRCPECARQKTRVTRGRGGAGPLRRPRDLRPDRAQRRRLPGRDRRRQRRAEPTATARSSIDFGLLGPLGRRRRVVPAADRRLPPRQHLSTSASTCSPSSSSAACWSRRSARRASSPSTSPRSSPAPSARSCSTRIVTHHRRLGGGLRHLRRAFVIARGRGIDALASSIGFILAAQPGDHLRHPEHQHRRPPRRSCRRAALRAVHRRRRTRHARPAAGCPLELLAIAAIALSSRSPARSASPDPYSGARTSAKPMLPGGSTRSGWRMWPSSSTPSTRRGPGREKVEAASTAKTRPAPSVAIRSQCSTA